jgi:hypothetical protein
MGRHLKQPEGIREEKNKHHAEAKNRRRNQQ